MPGRPRRSGPAGGPDRRAESEARRGLRPGGQGLAPPASSPRESTAHELALVAELACVLTVSERTARTLLAESQALTTDLPLTLAALESGSISWQHARIIVDETDGLGPAGAAAMEAHFLDPDAPTPPGLPRRELVPSRFRAKARTWRERHHPVSIEERHTTRAAERRVEYLPDRDGMAWLSAHLPASTAAGIWERTTAAARALQGPTRPDPRPTPRRRHRHLAPRQHRLRDGRRRTARRRHGRRRFASQRHGRPTS